MSGPIVRKYGFPNFDKIFGRNELQHGIDEGKEEPPPAAPEAEAPAEPEVTAKKAEPTGKKKKKS